MHIGTTPMLSQKSGVKGHSRLRSYRGQVEVINDRGVPLHNYKGPIIKMDPNTIEHTRNDNLLGF